jgi:recombination protein RecA
MEQSGYQEKVVKSTVVLNICLWYAQGTNKQGEVMAKKSSPSTVGNSLESIIEDINKQFGAGSIMRLNSNEVLPVEVISTGILPLDMALGAGGLPKGRIIEFYGPPSSGKSTLAMHAVAEAQSLGLACAYVDAEHALDPIYAKAVGVNLDELLLSQPSTAEEGLEITLRLVESGKIAMVIIDSVAALVPRAEIEGEMGDHHVGLQPRLMGQALRKLTGIVSKTGTIVIFINQLRESIGKLYGPSEYTPGGKALPYYASIRLDVRRIQTIKKGDEATANRTRVKVVKNKIAAPFKEAEFDLEYGVGVPKANALLDCAIDFGVLRQAGAWIYYNGEQFANGRLKAKAKLEEQPELYEEIYEQVIALTGTVPTEIIENEI